MVNRCAVFNCDYGRGSSTYNHNTSNSGSSFIVPKNRFLEWCEIFKDTKTNIKPKSYICEKHFNANDVIRGKVLKDPLGNVIFQRKFQKNYLKKNAVPIFIVYDETTSQWRPKADNRVECIADMVTEVIQNCENDLLDNTSNETLFEKLSKKLSNVQFPDLTWSFHINVLNKYVMFSSELTEDSNQSDNAPDFRKKVLVHEDGKVQVYFLNKIINTENIPQYVKSFEQVEQLLQTVQGLNICQGGPSVNLYNFVNSKCCYKDINYQKWRHILCLVCIPNGIICKKCATLDSVLRKHVGVNKQTKKLHLRLSSFEQKQYKIFKKTEYKRARLLKRTKTKLELLKSDIINLKQTMSKLDAERVVLNLQDNNISENQKKVIREIIALSKCTSKKGHRYNKQWILWCMLLRIRSQSVYNFLRQNDILPLPSFNTISGYLRSVDISCGFNKTFLSSLKNKISALPVMLRRGVLLLDEMSVRKSISVNSKNLKFEGIMEEDYNKSGPEDSSFNPDNLADHAFVMMFSSLGGKFHQPIATFASAGPVSGITMAQLAIQGIIEIEKCGGFVHGIICDGASTNRKMWQELGIKTDISNPVHFITNPADENRKIYAFSDTPHLFKCIRNRLLNNHYLKNNGEMIKWEFYETLHDIDSKDPSKLRLCPKLTKSHVCPSNMMKMRVSLATQIFSNSVATAMQMYEKRFPDEFQNCKPTMQFTKKMNDLFDVLNRTHAFVGIRKNSTDFQVLQQSLQWLNEWETEMINNKISKKEFLSDSTARGLRITLLSTLDLCNELLNKYNFTYVLTGKMNQDRLEQFFGMIRQAGCQNDHPNLPTFLQLYKLISTYYLLKPPKYGNCTVQDESPQNLLSTEDFNILFKNETSYSEQHISQLKQKLDGLIENTEWECDDVFNLDHDYSFSNIIDTIIYYVTGYICKKMKKITSCIECSKIFDTKETNSYLSEAELVNLRNRGKLIHPNSGLVTLFKHVEHHFVKNVQYETINVYDATMTDVLEKCNLTFPCAEHKEDVIAHCIHYYVTMRMRQWAKITNQELSKTNREKKKLAKLTVS